MITLRRVLLSLPGGEVITLRRVSSRLPWERRGGLFHGGVSRDTFRGVGTFLIPCETLLHSPILSDLLAILASLGHLFSESEVLTVLTLLASRG